MSLVSQCSKCCIRDKFSSLVQQNPSWVYRHKIFYICSVHNCFSGPLPKWNRWIIPFNLCFLLFYFLLLSSGWSKYIWLCLVCFALFIIMLIVFTTLMFSLRELSNNYDELNFIKYGNQYLQCWAPLKIMVSHRFSRTLLY